MVSTEDNTEIGYLLPYNNFMVVDDYDFEVLNKGKFKVRNIRRQEFRYQATRFYDDNYDCSMVLRRREQGQRCRFTLQLPL